MRISTRRVVCVAVILAATATATAATAAAATTATGGTATATATARPTKPDPSSASNHRAARLDALGHLRSLRLPADARRSQAEPAGGGVWLKPLLGLTTATASVDVH
ncbi:MAG: hypothetical protein ACR2NJ_00655, partial [Acidimicrobiales bacterium]